MGSRDRRLAHLIELLINNTPEVKKKRREAYIAAKTGNEGYYGGGDAWTHKPTKPDDTEKGK